MATNWFVDLPGFTWKRSRSPKWNTLVQTAASGLESRMSLYTLPRREWILPFDYLREGTPWFDVEALEGFFNNQQGQTLSFFLRDQYQCAVGGYYSNAGFGTFVPTTPGFIGVGTGSATVYQAQRILLAGSGDSGSGLSYSEPIFCIDGRGTYVYGPYTRPNTVSAEVYVNGTPTAATFSVETGTITFSTAPASGTTITAQFSYGFRVRFEEDDISFDNVFGALNEMKSLKIIQTQV